MNESTAALDERPKSSRPTSGSVDRSSPTIAPTNAVIATSNANCEAFSRRPNSTAGREAAGASLTEPRICVTQSAMTARLEQLSVPNDDAVEVPTENPIHRATRGGPVPQSPTEHRGRSGSPVCARGTRQGSHRSGRVLADREAQIADDQSPAWPVQKGDLGDEAVPEKGSLIEILAPPRIRCAPEQPVEREIPALAIKPRCTEELHWGIC